MLQAICYRFLWFFICLFWYLKLKYMPKQLMFLLQKICFFLPKRAEMQG